MTLFIDAANIKAGFAKGRSCSMIAPDFALAAPLIATGRKVGETVSSDGLSVNATLGGRGVR